MFYSNVTPPTLPAYDTTAYPYYVLVFNYYLREKDWNQVHLMYCASPLTYDTINGYVTTQDESYVWRVGGTDGAWSDETILPLKPTLSPGLKGEVYQRIYTNEDILDTYGDVWLAAGEVTPVERIFDKVSFWLGVALGLAGKGLPAKKAPTYYLYNGVKLPPLPEWDREMYPYAYMGFNGTGVDYELWFSTVPLYSFKNIYGSLRSSAAGSAIKYTYWVADDVDWNRSSTITTFDSPGDFITMFYLGAFWSNTDWLDETGKVLVPASVPIPYYPDTMAKCSYNGIELPELPDWDKETYPYAVIAEYGVTYGLYCFSEEPKADKLRDNEISYFVICDNKIWSSMTDLAIDTIGRELEEVKWANFDLCYNDGTLYLAATEPIPVYE